MDILISSGIIPDGYREFQTLKDELINVAATTVHWLECILRRVAIP